MPNQNKTEIVVALDSSGSMDSIRKAMESGFKEYIQRQRKEGGECVVSIYAFNSFWLSMNFVTKFEERSVHNVYSLGLRPGGGTPLIDGVCTTIDKVGRRLADKKESERPSRVIFLIVTDGLENASQEFKLENLQSKINRQTDDYKWTFVYLGANQDAFAEGSNYGVRGNFSKGNFSADDEGVSKMWENTGKMSSRKRAISLESYNAQAVTGQHYTASELADIESK